MIVQSSQGLGAPFISTTPMCQEGEGKVRSCRALLDRLVSMGKLERAAWEPAMVALESELDAAINPWSDWIPFNPACGIALDVGLKADALALRMTRAAGVQSAPPGKPGGGTSGSVGGFTLTTVLVIVGGIVALLILREVKS